MLPSQVYTFAASNFLFVGHRTKYLFEFDVAQPHSLAGVACLLDVNESLSYTANKRFKLISVYNFIPISMSNFTESHFMHKVYKMSIVAK